MTDLSEDFAAMRQESAVRRASNRDQSAKLLAEKGVRFVSKNNGAHLMVHNLDNLMRCGSCGHRETSAEKELDKDCRCGGTWVGEPQVDFWPGTGKWITRDYKKTTGRGVFGLLKYLGVK